MSGSGVITNTKWQVVYSTYNSSAGGYGSTTSPGNYTATWSASGGSSRQTCIAAVAFKPVQPVSTKPNFFMFFN